MIATSFRFSYPYYTQISIVFVDFRKKSVLLDAQSEQALIVPLGEAFLFFIAKNHLFAIMILQGAFP